ncbi:ABC transporter ATP-binding protein [Aminipila luticellarii]|uniref:ABC transporter ATP-binding protein n=1 Tax=Aminipila luticellarii TaxID=2507160 RepID=A0A410PT00_9FIRM|nr:ABC transporter ATP-binding protein [Aminipila luticellarii]QAT42044.1 ABC transporter ATP-binding protein [Aminipila luticellarii]
MDERRIAIQMSGITKTFGALKANEDVNLTVYEGEVHALLGENGAGKSTLMNMLSGIYTPDEGSIQIYGEEVHFASPKDSIKMGIGMIHQHFKLIDVLSAKDNIILGQKTGFFTKGKVLAKKVREISDQYGLDINPDKKVYDMSVGEKQTLEIIKVLFRGAKILILDEPTAVLTPQEIEKLFNIIRNMKAQGCAVVIITHKLNEVMEISDRITVLRKGHSVETVKTDEVEVSSLIEMMVGKKMDLSLERDIVAEKKVLLELSDVTVLDREKKPALSDATFDLRGGEILGVAGVAGSGQKELCEAIAGLAATEKGKIYFEGESLTGKTPRDIIKLGISMGFIPEDRLGMGLVGSMDIVHNLILKDYQNRPGFLLKRGPCVEKAKQIVEELDIQTTSIYAPVKKMSGGNIQKVLLGREIDLDPKVLITAYPVRGLDIGASYKIYDLLNEQKKKGVGVLFIGEDLDVLLELCDRIMVMCGGQITGIVNADQVTKEELGLLMTGTLLEEEEVGFNELA